MGNINYTGWVLRVPCANDSMLVSILQDLAKEMEEELGDWKRLVTNKREDFYELNYYTTVQLLTLRKELGRVMQSGKKDDVSPEVLSLLQSISDGITPSIVSDTVCRVTTEDEDSHVSSFDVNELPLDDTIADDDHTPAPAMVCDDSEQDNSGERDSVPVDPCTAAESDNSTQIPSLTEDSLSVELRGFMEDICTRLACSKKLVLRCFEELGDKLDKYDYEHWCASKLVDDESVSDSSGSIDDVSSIGDIEDTAVLNLLDESVGAGTNTFNFSCKSHVCIIVTLYRKI